MNAIEEEKKMSSVVSFYFKNYLDRLKSNISAYPNDWTLWVREGDIRNSAGNLCLYILHLLGEKFSASEQKPTVLSSNLTRSELIGKIENFKKQIEDASIRFCDDEFDHAVAITDDENAIAKSESLIQLLGDLNYHLGQINYHRRLI